MRILILGGAGFVGSALACALREHHADCQVTAFDNLRRRGSERNIARLAACGTGFVHGDIRQALDLDAIPGGRFDLVIDASAEPSVHAGIDGDAASLRYLIDTNLVGTVNALEFVRRRADSLIFLSTSRVYAVAALREVPLVYSPTRADLGPQNKGATVPGLSERGISEQFPVVGHGSRTLYGTTKLASELLVEEWAAAYGIPSIINRCGVIAGPGQFGKTDQGVLPYGLRAICSAVTSLTRGSAARGNRCATFCTHSTYLS